MKNRSLLREWTWACVRLCLTLTAFAAFLAAGCQEPQGHFDAWVVWDSAGIEMVESHPQPPDGRERVTWRISEDPILTLGAVEGPEELQFHSIRHAQRLEDGRLAIIDGGSAQVRIFARTGEYLYSVGRQGEGPGEFFGPPSGTGGQHGDSLIVFHGVFVSLFGPHAEFVRRFMLETEDGRAVRPLGRLSDGSVIGVTNAPTRVRVDGAFRQDLQVLRYDLEGRLLGIVGEFPEQLIPEGEQTYPFGYRGRVALGDSSIWYAWSEEFELTEIAPDGRTIRISRLDREADPLTGAEIAAYETARRDNPGTTPPELLERFLSTYTYPPTRPVLSDILIDDRGNVWVHEFEIPFGSERRAWHVFDPEGRYIGVVNFPERFQPYEIGSDAVLGRWTDDVGVHHVQLLALETGSK